MRMAELATDAGDEAGAAKILAEVPDALSAGRSAERGALAAGVRRLARRAARRGARTGWTRTCASSRTRRSGTPRGASSTGRGACSRSRGTPEEARASYERAVREYPLSVYALLALARLKTPTPDAAEGAGRLAAQGAPRRPRPGRSRRARSTATPGFLRAVELARMGQGGDARRELARLGLATVGRQARAGARRRAPRMRTSSGSPRSCSTAAASGAPRTRSRATA